VERCTYIYYIDLNYKPFNNSLALLDTFHDHWGPEKYNYTMMKYGAIFYSRHTGTKTLFNLNDGILGFSYLK